MTMKAMRRIARRKLIGIVAAFALLAALLPIGGLAQAEELRRKMTPGGNPLFGVPDEPDPHKPDLVSPDGRTDRDEFALVEEFQLPILTPFGLIEIDLPASFRLFHVTLFSETRQ